MAPRSTYKVITDDVKAIRVLRIRRELSVNKAAVLVGTNKSTLTALENGRIDLSDQWVTKILKGYKSNREAFESIKKDKLGSKEQLVNEINILTSKLSFEKLETILKLLNSFCCFVAVLILRGSSWI